MNLKEKKEPTKAEFGKDKQTGKLIYQNGEYSIQ